MKGRLGEGQKRGGKLAQFSLTLNSQQAQASEDRGSKLPKAKKIMIELALLVSMHNKYHIT